MPGLKGLRRRSPRGFARRDHGIAARDARVARLIDAMDQDRNRADGSVRVVRVFVAVVKRERLEQLKVRLPLNNK